MSFMKVGNAWPLAKSNIREGFHRGALRLIKRKVCRTDGWMERLEGPSPNNCLLNLQWV